MWAPQFTAELNTKLNSFKIQFIQKLCNYLVPIPYYLKEQENKKFYNHDKEYQWMWAKN